MEPVILHCDLNSFYASVECLRDPSLWERPMAVCGASEERHGIVLSKNQAAKRRGVLTGEATWQAKQKCPELAVVQPHVEEYLKYSKQVRDIYERYTDRVESFGIDECWLDVGGSRLLFGDGKTIADKIRENIRTETKGLTVSVGVSFNKVFAKLGSDLRKPDATSCVTREGFREEIWPLPAELLLGAGRATVKALSQLGIRSIGDLARADPDCLRRRLGANGVALWGFANGLDRSEVLQSAESFPIKSIGRGTTPVRDLTDEDAVWRVLYALAQDVGRRLRESGMKAQTVQISVRDSLLQTRQYQGPLPRPTQLAAELARTGMALLKEHYPWSQNIRTLTLRAIRLLPEHTPQQLDIFEDFQRQERLLRLDHTVDALCRRYGRDTVRSATLMLPADLPANEGFPIFHS